MRRLTSFSTVTSVHSGKGSGLHDRVAIITIRSEWDVVGDPDLHAKTEVAYIIQGRDIFPPPRVPDKTYKFLLHHQRVPVSLLRDATYVSLTEALMVLMSPKKH